MMKTYHTRLAQYASLSIAFIAINEADAQVAYSDIDPDIVLDSDFDDAGIDMDSSGVYDFAFTNQSFTVEDWTLGTLLFQKILAGPYVIENAIAGTSGYIFTGSGTVYRFYPYALEDSIPVNNDLSFQNWGFQRMAFRTSIIESATDIEGGNWYPEVLDHYLGVRFIDTAGCNHYGWIRCDVKDEGRTLIIKDYAYETLCDSAIIAGDVGDTTTIDTIDSIDTTIVDVFNLQMNDIFIYSFGSKIYIHFLNEITEPAQVTVYDVTGKEVYKGYISQKTNTIELYEPPKGVYAVNIISNKGRYSKKVFVK